MSIKSGIKSVAKNVKNVRITLILLAISGILATRSYAASVTLGATIPSVGDGVENLNFSTAAASDTQLQYVPDNSVGDRTDGLTIGQTFTTGSNAGGYSLTSISVRQVSWSSTSWDYTGGNVTIRIFDMNGSGGAVGNGVWNASELVTETVSVGGAAGGVTIKSTPSSPRWLTFTLSSPLALDPNTLYGFTIGSDGTSSNDGFFMELDGTSTNSYADGFAISVDTTANLWDGGNGEPSDRAFVATMTTQSATATSDLNIQRVGSNIELTWTSGTLLEAENMNGPWVTNAHTSPYQFAPMGLQKFYRLAPNTGFYTWPAYDPNVAYDYVDEFGIMNPPTEVLNDVTGVQGVYTNGWWSFVYGTNANSLVTSNAWIPMVQRFNTDFSYIANVLRWPRDPRAQHGYYSGIYLFGSGLSTDSASNTDLGGWQSATTYRGKAWPMALLSYYPVYSFDPACPYADAGAQQGDAVHEGIHCILAGMPGCYNSAWTGEAGNTWLQGTMESQRSGDFSGMGWLSAAAAIAQFMPIECYSGWLQDGSFGGPSAEGVYQTDGTNTLCTWRNLLGGTQYGECFMYCMDTILGYQSVAWAYRHCNKSGRLLQDLAEQTGGLGPEQTRRLIQEFRGRAAMCDFRRKSYAYQQLLVGVWNTPIQEEYSPYWIDVPVWNATCYVATTNVNGTLYPEARTLPGWSGANQIPLTVSGSTASVTFNPQGANMSCQLVYRDTSGQVRYSYPVSSGVCSIPLQNVLNNVVIAVVCNTDYTYQGEYSRTNKFNYTLTLGPGMTGTANIYTKWFAYNPATYAVSALATGPGSISPAGTNMIAAGGNVSFTITPGPGYDVLQVLAGGVPVGVVTNYTFRNVRGNVSIEAQFGLKTYRIYAKSSPAGSITPSGFTTVNPGAGQGYSVTPNSGWALYSLKVDGVDQGPLTSYTFDNVQADHNIKASYYGNNPSVPQPANLLFALSTDTLETNGVIDSWDAYAPGGFSAYGLQSPAVEMINGVKWANNIYSDADGFGIESSTTPIPCNGATIVVAVKPTRNGIDTAWNSIVDCFYSSLVLGLKNSTGELIVFRNGTQFNTGVIIPDGQQTVLSLVVQNTGTFKVYSNGTQVYSSGVISMFNQLTPGSYSFMHDITVGRNSPDGWTTFNGNIGDVYVYTTALSSADRQQLENFIRTKFEF